MLRFWYSNVIESTLLFFKKTSLELQVIIIINSSRFKWSFLKKVKSIRSPCCIVHEAIFINIIHHTSQMLSDPDSVRHLYYFFLKKQRNSKLTQFSPKLFTILFENFLISYDCVELTVKFHLIDFTFFKKLLLNLELLMITITFMMIEFFCHELMNKDPKDILFQQDRATPNFSNDKWQKYPERIISRNGDDNWPP